MKSLLILTLLFATRAMAADAVLPSDKVKIGKTGSTDKTIEASLSSTTSTNPKIKLNSSLGRWQYSNDGTNFKDIGSGSGGGFNYLTPSPDAEAGTTGWSVFDNSQAVTLTTATPSVFTTSSAHGLQVGNVVAISGTGSVTGFTLDALYYVYTVPSSTTFTISNFLGSSQVAVSAQSGTFTLRSLTPPTLSTVGTGGSPGVTWTVSSSSPLRDLSSFLFTKAASDQVGQGVSTDFTVANADQGKMENISFEYSLVSGTYQSQTPVPVSPTSPTDLQVWVYDKTNAQVIQVAGMAVPSGVAGTSLRYLGSFQAATNSTSYRLILIESYPGTSAYVMKLDNFVVGPPTKTAGSVITDWQTCTASFPSVTLGTGGTTYCYYRRAGDSMEVQQGFTLGTSPSVPANLVMNPPLGTIDTSKAGVSSVGEWRGFANSTSTRYSGTTLQNGGQIYGIVNGNVNNVGTTVPFTWAVNDSYNAHYTVPMVGWGATVQLGTDVGDGRAVGASYFSTFSLGSLGTQAIPGSTKLYDTHGMLSSTSIYTAPIPGMYKLNLHGYSAGTTLASHRIDSYFQKNGSIITGCQSVSVVAASSQRIPLDNTCSVLLAAGDQIVAVLTNQGAAAISIDTMLVTMDRINSGNQQITPSDSVSLKYSTAAGQAFTNTDAIVVFGTKVWDTHSAYNASTGVFTAPLPGKYKVTCRVMGASQVVPTTSTVALTVYKNGVSDQELDRKYGNGSAIYMADQGSDTLQMVQGDQADCRVSGTTSNNLYNSAQHNYITIERVGN